MMIRFAAIVLSTLMAEQAFAYINVNPSFVNFGSVEINSFGPRASIFISNQSDDAANLQVSPLGCGLAFDVQNFGCFQLPARGSCQISVAFRPTRVGPQSCTVSLYAGAAGSAQINLSGNGVDRRRTVSEPADDVTFEEK